MWKRRLRVIGGDFRRGRNIDAYVAAFAAVVAGVLGLLGVELRWIAPVLLLCMVPLLNLALTINDKVDTGHTDGPMPLVEFPHDQIGGDWARRTDLLLVGVSLIRTVRTHEGDISERLQGGRHVRVLVVDPDDALSMALTDRRRRFGDADPVSNAAEVRSTLDTLDRLAKVNPSGSLEIRTLDFPISLGGYAFSPGRLDARMYVETYPFKTAETQPHFLIDRTHVHWFEHFASELENMWQAGKEHKQHSHAELADGQNSVTNTRGDADAVEVPSIDSSATD